MKIKIKILIKKEKESLCLVGNKVQPKWILNELLPLYKEVKN
jgi:hypothetical protein